MRNTFSSLCILSLFLFGSTNALEAEKKIEVPPSKVESTTIPKFEPFTGKIAKNRVRLRLQSNFDSPILRELNKNDLILILGETDDFYAVQPPVDFPGYVFRTYVLDNIVEGSRVNVRLKPDTESPVVAQLESGYRVEGSIASANNKWLEIKLPNSTRFYVAKEYVEKAGDASFKARFEKKRNDLYHLLNTTESLSHAEIRKPFEQMMIDGLKANYQHIIYDFPEFPEASLKAKENLAALQESYTSKKVAYLENQAKASSSTIETNKKLSAELQEQKMMITQLETEIEKNRQFAPLDQPQNVRKRAQLPFNMSAWLPIEETLFNEWQKKNGQSSTPQQFYEQQKQEAIVLRGVIDTYNRPVKNKPGDYMIVNQVSKLPVAFLYSTHINLQEFLGHEVSITVSPRDNHHFAFPAYFVLKIE